MSQNLKELFIQKYVTIKTFLKRKSDERTYDEIIDIRNILESFPFFIQFTNTKSQDFLDMCKHLGIEEYEEDCTLFKQGDQADKFYVVLNGKGYIYVKIPGVEEEKQVGQVGIGGSFGELALLFNSERNATIKIDAQTELMTLHKDDFKKYMKFKSSEHAHQAFNLINSMDEFKGLDFPNRVRLASKMDYKQFTSSYPIIQQGQMFSNFYLVENGLIKFYRDVSFNTTESGSISFQNQPSQQEDLKSQRRIQEVKKRFHTRSLKIEIDEIGPGRFFGEYELFNFKPSQYTAVTHMPTTVFIISQFDFNLMNQYQLQEICQNAKPYPSDFEIRNVFLEGVQWRVFRKQLVDHLYRSDVIVEKNNVWKSKDLNMFAVKSLTYEGLLDAYINDNQVNDQNEDQQNNQMMLGSSVKIQPKKKERSIFQNVENGIKQMKQAYELQTIKSQRQKPTDIFTSPKSSKKILPKINPKVGSKIYNLLIGK